MAALDDARPRCPRCGEPAREVSGVAQVMATLALDGTPAQVLRVTRFAATARYRCGGGHSWKMTSGESEARTLEE